MLALRLSAPLRIRPAGTETVRDVSTLQDASEILIDWPHAKRGPFYQTAREQIEAALEGRATAAQAQEAFSAFCVHAGVLVR
ncbi:MAG: DUF982 domain-containing protein [Mesorhizobium sp.]